MKDKGMGNNENNESKTAGTSVLVSDTVDQMKYTKMFKTAVFIIGKKLESPHDH